MVNDSDRIDYINADVISGEEPADVAERIRQELRRERNVAEGEENFSVSTSDDLIELFLGILNTVQYVVIGIVSIALLVGGIGIMNTMYMSINERTNEIGVLKAIGASKRQIRMLFLLESGLIGLIGGIIGVLIGVGISEIAVFVVGEYVSTVSLARGYNLTLVAGALTFSTLLGILSGYLPSRRASQLEPAEALRYE